MELIKALRAANRAGSAETVYLPAVPVNRNLSPTIGADMATGINSFGLTGFMFELPPEDNERLLREGYKNNHIVFSVVDWKAQKMSEATPILYQVKNKKEYSRYKAYQRSGLALDAMVARVKALEEVDEHPILKLLAKPNERQTWREFCYATSVYWDFGNAPVWGQRVGAGVNRDQIRRLYNLPPHIYVGENPSVAGYDVYAHAADPKIRLLGSDVRHLKRFNSDQGSINGTLWGMSKLTPARALLTKSRNSVEAEAELMGNRGGRFIIFPKASQFNENTDVASIVQNGREATEAIRKKLRQVGAGGIAGNAFELDAIDLSMSPVDLDIIESSKITKEDFCALWRVDPLAVFSSTSGTYANADAAIKRSLISGVLPDLHQLAAELTEFVCPAYGDGYVIDFDTDVYPELQPDKKAIAEYLDSIPLTGDERRQVFKWGVTGKAEMQVEMIKNNLVPIRDMLAPTDTPSEEPLKNDGTYKD